MAYSAILFSYFFRRSSIASSSSLDFVILVFLANSSKGFTNSFANEDVNLVRFTYTGSAKQNTTL